MGVSRTAAALVAAPLALGPAAALAVPSCVDVESRKGWQEIPALTPHVVAIDTRGAWTVDSRSYAPVDAIRGHTGADAEKLAPFAQYRFLPEAEFGELLLRFNGKIWRALDVEDRERAQSRLLVPPGEVVEARINDRDEALGDNAGTVTVCLEFG